MQRTLGVLALLTGALSVQAATPVSCESSPAVAAEMRSFDRKIETASFTEQLALYKETVARIAKQDPADVRFVQRYIGFLRYEAPDQLERLRAFSLDDAQKHPEDAAKLSIAALASRGKDTPQAFRFLEQARAANPNYAPADVLLAGFYSSSGKFTDKVKAAIYLSNYYQLCPASRYGSAMFLLKQLGSPALKAEVAKNLRARLAETSDPYTLSAMEHVWSLEFSTLPVPEYAKERQRIADDLNRLEKIPASDPAWLMFLEAGYKQSGAPQARIQELEERIVKEFPHSDEALGVLSDRWDKEHPRPAAEASAADWQNFLRDAISQDRQWMAQFPQAYYYESIVFEDLSNLDDVSGDELAREAEAYIKTMDLRNGEASGSRRLAAGAFLDRNIHPSGAFELLESARALMNSSKEKAQSELADYVADNDRKKSEQYRQTNDASFRVLYLRACRATGNKSATERLKPEIESSPSGDMKLAAINWNARAILAEIEGHNTDALAYFQKALLVREPPKKQFGKLDDPLLADAKRLWTSAGGTETAFAIWSQPEKSSITELAEGRWEKPSKELPPFELADVQGKTWKLKSLEGKKLLINIWATWCGPCKGELPLLQKLYDQVKNRSDIAILTLNLDEDPGLIEPFMKEKGYTFPVLLAYSFLSNKLDVNSIPRNWLVDANGKWQWEQIGFNSGEADWGKSMLAKLEDSK